MRINKEGHIIYPQRGNPPRIPHGYGIKDGNPYTLIPILPPCDYREEKVVKTQCCESNRIYCKYYKKDVVRLTCINCEVIKNEIEKS